MAGSNTERGEDVQKISIDHILQKCTKEDIKESDFACISYWRKSSPEVVGEQRIQMQLNRKNNVSDGIPAPFAQICAK